MAANFADSIDPAKAAVLFIEYQNEFATPGGKLHDAVKPVMDENNVLSNSIFVASKARELGIKVFHAPITFSDNYRELSKEPYGILGNVKAGQCFIASAWGGDFNESMRPAPEDIVVSGKRGLCAFASTNLDFLLRQNGIEVLVLAGYLTNCCVESTMRTAYEKGYKVITLTDCCAATSKEAQTAAVTFTFPMFSIPLKHDAFLAKF